MKMTEKIHTAHTQCRTNEVTLRFVFYFSAAHCLNPSGIRLKEEEIKVGIGKLLSNYYEAEPGARILKVS